MSEPQPSGSHLWPQLDYAPVDPDAATIGFFILAGGSGDRVEARVTMGGNTRTRSFPANTTELVREYLIFNPCAHPGGSDLPGASAQFETVLIDGESEVETVGFLTRLGPDTARPAVTLNAEPASGAQVEPGDQISFDVTAQEARSGLSWQTGVRDLRVKAFPGEDLVPQVRADSSTPQPCDRKQWSLIAQGTYEVPDDPPPTFRICPIANDFAGNQNNDTCATYFTEEVWEGTYTGTVTFDCEGLGQIIGTLEGEFTITVDEGVATMDIIHTVTGSCGGPDFGTLTAPISATGERTPTGFEFASFGALFGGSGPLTIDVSGDRGTGAILLTDLDPGIVMVELAVGITRA